MKESMLHYIWQQKLFAQSELFTTDGQLVEVIDVGKYNTDGGPDFFNAKIKMGQTLWAGNIEIHCASTDWAKHGHCTDKAYDTVILHVVTQCDCNVQRTDGSEIPQMILRYNAAIEEQYEQLLAARKWVACADKICDVHPLFISAWKNALLTERLLSKSAAINQLLTANNQHWEEAFYVSLARSFGFSTNSQAFEQLALSLPLVALGKHKNNILQIEAMLYGQSGLLPAKSQDAYIVALQQEYKVLKAKFGLQTMDGAQWKLLRLRPENFPHIRIAQFAALVQRSSKLFSKVIEQPDHEQLIKLFEVEASDYWLTHYIFEKECKKRKKHLGQKSIESLLINTVVPFLFCYAHSKDNQLLKDRAIALLEKLPAENNAIVNGWEKLGQKIDTAYDSQAFIHLKKNYCDDKKCLRCRIGHKVLSAKIK